ncbi:MAG TPA: hypothetical protein VEA36_00950 [Candidatus Paceibacterota bacterium]|nr:hypothetical protein [Candidatus Paceibacterota bacterium]
MAIHPDLLSLIGGTASAVLLILTRFLYTFSVKKQDGVYLILAILTTFLGGACWAVTGLMLLFRGVNGADPEFALYGTLVLLLCIVSFEQGWWRTVNKQPMLTD